MDPAFHRIEELDAKISSGTALLWAGRNAAVVTEVLRYPAALVLHAVCATGDLNEIVGELTPRAEEWGKRAGCTHAMVESRPGWTRALKDRGYGPHTVTLRKEL